MDPIIGASLIAGGTQLFGGIANAFGQSSANRTNVKLQREAQAWQESMWNKQNEYNTPAAQIQRMRDAGLNPALMYSQGNVGNAESVKAVPPAQVQPITGLGNGISSAGDAIADGLIKLEQVKQMRAQTNLLEAKVVHERNSTLDPFEYRAIWDAKNELARKQSQYYDSKTAWQDIYNQHTPTLLYNRQRQGELYNNKLQQDMAVQVAMLSLKALETRAQVQLNSAQTGYYQQMVKLMAQKYNYLEQLNPLQIQAINQKLVIGAKDIDWYNTNEYMKIYDRIEKTVDDIWQNLNKSASLGADYLDSLIPG